MGKDILQRDIEDLQNRYHDESLADRQEHIACADGEDGVQEADSQHAAGQRNEQEGDNQRVPAQQDWYGAHDAQRRGEDGGQGQHSTPFKSGAE